MSPLPPPTLKTEILCALAEEVRRELGLSFPASRQHNLESGLAEATLRLAAPDLAALLGRLQQGDREAWNVLIPQLTVGETFFFRNARHFDILRDILRKLPPKPRKGPRLLWSAGCSTGEEAYSMAITALSALGPGAAAEVEVLGTDINLAALCRAREGLYNEWSFRCVQPDVRDRWFERQQGRARVVPQARAMVRFEQQNLLSASAAAPKPIPAAPSPPAAEVIFCRNVFLYLDAESLAKVGASLALSLAPSGWLFTSPADPPLCIPGLERVTRDGFVLYRRSTGGPPCPLRRGGAPERPPPPLAELPAPSPLAPPAQHLPAAHLPLALPPFAPPPVPDAPSSASAEPWIVRARRLADQGDAPAALELLDQAIAQDPLEQEAYVLRAIILQALSDHARAALDAERAILLDRSSAMAHLLSAVSKEWLGDDAGARRAARNAERLLSASPKGAPVPSAFGATGAELITASQEMSRVLTSPRRPARRRSGR